MFTEMNFIWKKTETDQYAGSNGQTLTCGKTAADRMESLREITKQSRVMVHE
jgi:hypothetical protein